MLSIMALPIENFKLQLRILNKLSEFLIFSVSFRLFQWCLKAKFQIPPLRSVMFAVNTTTRAASNLDYLQF